MPFFWTLTHVFLKRREDERNGCMFGIGRASSGWWSTEGKREPLVSLEGPGNWLQVPPQERHVCRRETSYWTWSNFEILFFQRILEVWESVDKSAYLPFSAPHPDWKEAAPTSDWHSGEEPSLFLLRTKIRDPVQGAASHLAAPSNLARASGGFRNWDDQMANASHWNHESLIHFLVFRGWSSHNSGAIRTIPLVGG